MEIIINSLGNFAYMIAETLQQAGIVIALLLAFYHLLKLLGVTPEPAIILKWFFWLLRAHLAVNEMLLGSLINFKRAAPIFGTKTEITMLEEIQTGLKEIREERLRK